MKAEKDNGMCECITGYAGDGFTCGKDSDLGEFYSEQRIKTLNCSNRKISLWIWY